MPSRNSEIRECIACSVANAAPCFVRHLLECRSAMRAQSKRCPSFARRLRVGATESKEASIPRQAPYATPSSPLQPPPLLHFIFFFYFNSVQGLSEAKVSLLQLQLWNKTPCFKCKNILPLMNATNIFKKKKLTLLF